MRERQYRRSPVTSPTKSNPTTNKQFIINHTIAMFTDILQTTASLLLTVLIAYLPVYLYKKTNPDKQLFN